MPSKFYKNHSKRLILRRSTSFLKRMSNRSRFYIKRFFNVHVWIFGVLRLISIHIEINILWKKNCGRRIVKFGWKNMYEWVVSLVCAWYTDSAARPPASHEYIASGAMPNESTSDGFAIFLGIFGLRAQNFGNRKIGIKTHKYHENM